LGIKIPATTKEQCVKVPNGILGIFGLTKDKCYTIEIPEQVISNVLAGGGNQTRYILESELIKNNNLRIIAKSLPIAKTIEDVQNNYLSLNQNELAINFI